MKQYHFLVYGEDERQSCLKDILENRGHVAKKAEESSAGSFDAILLPPSDTERYLKKIKENLRPGQMVFGSNFGSNEEMQAAAGNICPVDYMREEGVAEKNAVSVAEGILAEAIGTMKQNLCGSRCLVCGFGRCGSAVAKRLVACGGRVDVLEKDRSKKQAVMEAGADWKERVDPADYALIVNTVPKLLFTGAVLRCCRQDVCLLDLASKPGGVDLAYCKERGICARRCPGLPARYAPRSAAEILADVIENKMEIRAKGE